MFELSPSQIQVIEALLSPFGLILLVQAAKWLARRAGAEIGRVHIRVFLGALSAALAYFWLGPQLPPLPDCAALEPCLNELATFSGALGGLATAWFGAAHLIYEKLARGLFEQLGLQ